MDDTKQEREPVDVASAETVRGLLNKLLGNLMQTERVTVSEYIRLLELLRELEAASVTEVRVRWIE